MTLPSVGAGVRGAKRRALEMGIPLFVYLELTYRCNWRCVFCYNQRHHDLEVLTLAEWTRVLDGLRRLGTLTVTLTGGEPLLHPDFFAIVEAARQRAFAVRIFTNGSLVDGPAADHIAALAPLSVEMSLHGATPAVHDRTTGVDGSFEALWGSVDRLLRRGVRVLLKTPLTRHNHPELAALIALAAQRGIPLRVDPAILPRADGDLCPLAWGAPSSAVADLMGHLRQQDRLPARVERRAGGVNCGLGQMTLAVDPEGSVFPCIQWRLSRLGSVRDTPIETLWRESPVRDLARAVAVSAHDRLRTMGGALAAYSYCPVVAWQRTGDPLCPDATFLANALAAAKARGDTDPQG